MGGHRKPSDDKHSKREGGGHVGHCYCVPTTEQALFYSSPLAVCAKADVDPREDSH